MHRLSDIFGAATERDCEITGSGFASTRVQGIVSFAGAARYVAEAADNPDIAALVTTPELAGMWPVSRGLALDASPERAFYLAHNRLAD
ncbi:MAG: hypothetical protein AAFQ51_13465, partial [Pseudomonadota bacterium]